MLNGEKGFTLIELLVVIIILGILLAVAIPRYFEGVQQAKVKNFCSTISNLKMAIEVYRTANTASSYTFPTADQVAALLTDKKYFDKVPKDPFTGNDFTIVTSTPSATNQIEYLRLDNGNNYELYFIPGENATVTNVCP